MMMLSSIPMRWTWDPAAGAIYLHVRPVIGKVVTVDLSEGDPAADILLDIDTGTGQLTGVEILIPDGGSTFTRLKALLEDEPEILGG